MRIINLSQDKATERFARHAAEYFTLNPKISSYTEGELQMEALIALRWNEYSVLVFEIGNAFEPKIYPTTDLVGYDLSEPEKP